MTTTNNQVAISIQASMQPTRLIPRFDPKAFATENVAQTRAPLGKMNAL